MDTTRLYNIAEYHFRKIRTNCTFVKIQMHKNIENGYIVYGLFKCKRGISIKEITLNKDGDLIRNRTL